MATEYSPEDIVNILDALRKTKDFEESTGVSSKGVIKDGESTNNNNTLAREISNIVKDQGKVSGSLTSAEESRYTAIFKILKRVLMPGPEADTLEGIKGAGAVGAGKITSRDRKRAAGIGAMGVAAGAAGAAAAAAAAGGGGSGSPGSLDNEKNFFQKLFDKTGRVGAGILGGLVVQAPYILRKLFNGVTRVFGGLKRAGLRAERFLKRNAGPLTPKGKAPTAPKPKPGKPPTPMKEYVKKITAGNKKQAGSSLMRGVGRFGLGLLKKVAAPIAFLFTINDAQAGFRADKDAGFGKSLLNAGSSALKGFTAGLLGSSAEEIKKKAQAGQKIGQANQLLRPKDVSSIFKKAIRIVKAKAVGKKKIGGSEVLPELSEQSVNDVFRFSDMIDAMDDRVEIIESDRLKVLDAQFAPPGKNYKEIPTNRKIPSAIDLNQLPDDIIKPRKLEGELKVIDPELRQTNNDQLNTLNMIRNGIDKLVALQGGRMQANTPISLTTETIPDALTLNTYAPVGATT